MAPPLLRIQRRLFSSLAASKTRTDHKCSVKQVTKSNFNDSLDEIKAHVDSSDFVAISLQNTGSYSAAWHRVSALDTPLTAYLKAKHAAERFLILQFAVCPFSVTASKLTAYPYNFNLFPRDELKLGMPSYSFSCQASRLTAMASEGFDFNACIYDGISYLSRAQEPVAKLRLGNPMPADHATKSTSPPTVADSVFVGRVRSRVKHWKNACTQSSSNKDDVLLRSLKKLVLGSEEHGSRPCMTIDVCSERQVQLVLEMLVEFSDELVPLLIPCKGGGTQAVRVVLTSSKEDKILFEKELQDLEVNQNKRICGFRGVIDLIAASQKPIVSQNSLNDFTFIHSKFLAPLPTSMDEFISSLSSVFPHILDLNHLIKEIGPLKKSVNVPASMSYLKNRFFAPFDVEIRNQDMVNQSKVHGHNIVAVSELFARLCSILKMNSSACQSIDRNHSSALEECSVFSDSFSESSQDPLNEEVRIWSNNTRKVSSENLIFVWGFGCQMSAGTLKNLLRGSHEVFSQEFDVRFVDKSCAVVVFWQPSLSDTFLKVVNSDEVGGSLRDMVSEGLRTASYKTYKQACRLGFWEADLAESLEKTLQSDSHLEADSESKPSEIYWSSESIINFHDL